MRTVTSTTPAVPNDPRQRRGQHSRSRGCCDEIPALWSAEQNQTLSAARTPRFRSVEKTRSSERIVLTRILCLLEQAAVDGYDLAGDAARIVRCEEGSGLRYLTGPDETKDLPVKPCEHRGTPR